MLRSWLTGLVALVLALILSVPALAQPASDPEGEKVFDFEGDTIEAEFLKPNVGVVESVLRDERKSLIKIRVDFVDEIVRSAEEL